MATAASGVTRSAEPPPFVEMDSGLGRSAAPE